MHVPDYSSAVLMPAAVVHKFNSRLHALGEVHQQLIGRTARCRRRIGTAAWEAQRLALLSAHLAETHTDLQVFRVTRGLQKVLREGASAEDAKVRVKIRDKLVYVVHVHTKCFDFL
jgi:hypothetical protein